MRMVFAYDLSEDRRTIDVIITNFFTLCFKMSERFENLDNSLRHRAKEKILKSLVEALNGHEKQEEETNVSFLGKSGLSRQSSESKPSTKLVSKINFKIKDFCCLE